MKEVKPTAGESKMSEVIYVEPFTRYVMYVEAHPVATQRRGAISNMLVFTTDMSGQCISHCTLVDSCIVSVVVVVLSLSDLFVPVSCEECQCLLLIVN